MLPLHPNSVSAGSTHWEVSKKYRFCKKAGKAEQNLTAPVAQAKEAAGAWLWRNPHGHPEMFPKQTHQQTVHFFSEIA